MPESQRARRARRRRIEHAGEVPSELIDEVIEDMAWRMSRGAAARRCVGLSFSFRLSDHTLNTARYEVAAGGLVLLERTERGASFEFSGPVAQFDAVLSGGANAWAALLRRRIRMRGSLGHIRQILEMMPAVESAYTTARSQMLDRHAHRYEFRL